MRKRASQPARPARLHGPASNRPAPPARSSRPAHELVQAQQPSDQQPTTKQPVLQAPWRLCVFFSSLLMIFLSMFSSFTNSLGHKYLQFFIYLVKLKKLTSWEVKCIIILGQMGSMHECMRFGFPRLYVVKANVFRHHDHRFPCWHDAKKMVV